MKIDLLDAHDNVITIVETGNPLKELEFYKTMLPDVMDWRHHVEVETLDQAKTRYISSAGSEFAKRRDAIRWVDGYGYDCEPGDIINFMAAFTPLLVAKAGTVLYKVWTSETEKAVVERSYEQLLEVYNTVRTEQMEAYAWYETIKANLQAAESIEELKQIYPLGGE